MSEQNDPRDQQQMQAVRRYMNALESSDLAAVAAAMNEAEQDPVLEAMLLKVNRRYQSQDGIAVHGDDLLQTRRFLSMLREDTHMSTDSERIDGNAPITGVGKQRTLQERRKHTMQSKILSAPFNPTPPRWTAYFAQGAAVLAVGLLIIGFLLVFSLRSGARWQITQTSGQPGSPSGLYISRSTSVSRLDAQTRNVIWQTHVASQAGNDYSHLVVIGDTVYIYSGMHGGNRISAFNAYTGGTRWSRTFNENVLPLALDDGLLAVTSAFPGHATLYMLNPATGKIIITYTPKQEYGQSLTVEHGILFYMAGPSLYAVQLAGEKLLWQQQIGNQTQFLEDISLHNGIVYASVMQDGPQTGMIESFDAQSGRKLWQSPPLPRGVRMFTITNGMIYAAAVDELVAFDEHTHALVWHQPLNTAAILVASGTLYITYDAGNDPHEGFAALNARTGRPLWHKINRAGGGVELAGIINGVFYGIGVSNDGKEVTLYALNASTGAELWTVPEGPFSQWGGLVAT